MYRPKDGPLTVIVPDQLFYNKFRVRSQLHETGFDAVLIVVKIGCFLFFFLYHSKIYVLFTRSNHEYFLHLSRNGNERAIDLRHRQV